jgi:hypothetical protein
MMPPGRGFTTAELGVNLVRAIGAKAPRVRAEGKVIHCRRQLATAEGRLYGPDGTLYAQCHHDLPGVRDALKGLTSASLPHAADRMSRDLCARLRHEPSSRATRD